MKNQIRVYVSHSIRGKKGIDATVEDMEHNNDLAIDFGGALRDEFPTIDFYVPGDHDEFVLISYLQKYLTEEQILAVDCVIVRRCYFVIAYSPDGFLSKGMRIEIEDAGKAGIPVIIVAQLDEQGIEAINRQLDSFMR